VAWAWHEIADVVEVSVYAEAVGVINVLVEGIGELLYDPSRR
jgi:hypothetical protein